MLQPCEVGITEILSWINRDRKSKNKGSTKIQVWVIKHTIETDGELKTYRLVTSLMDLALFPALFLAEQYPFLVL